MSVDIILPLVAIAVLAISLIPMARTVKVHHPGSSRTAIALNIIAILVIVALLAVGFLSGYEIRRVA